MTLFATTPYGTDANWRGQINIGYSSDLLKLIEQSCNPSVYADFVNGHKIWVKENGRFVPLCIIKDGVVIERFAKFAEYYGWTPD